MCSCHSILECCVMFSGVKLSIRSFVLFLSIIDSQTVPMSNDKVQLKMLKCKNYIDSVLFKLKEDKPGLNWLK